MLVFYSYTRIFIILQVVLPNLCITLTSLSDTGWSEIEYIKNIVKNVNKEISIDNILIVKRQNDLICHLNEFNSIGVPTLRFNESTKMNIKAVYNSKALALVCMSNIVDISLLTSLAENINGMREARIIIWLNNLTATSRYFLKLISEQANFYNFLNLLVVHLKSHDSESTITSYRLQPFPNATFQRIANINEGLIFPKMDGDYHEKTAVILPDFGTPRNLLLSDEMKTKLKFSGVLDQLIKEFSKRYNIKLRIYSTIKKLSPREILNLTINNQLHLPLRYFSSDLESENNVEYLSMLEVGAIYVIVPCEKEISISHVYIKLRTYSWIILGAYFIFALLETIIMGVTFRMFRGSFQFSYSSLLINLRAFCGVLGLSVQLSRHHNSVSLKQIVMAMSFFGIIFSSLFNANLSTLLIKQPRTEKIQNFNQLRNSELQVSISKDQRAYVERKINANFFETVLPNVKTMAMKEQQQLLLSFDTNYAYVMYPTLWDALDLYQRHYNQKILCKSESMVLANGVPVSGIVSINSIYKLALNEFIQLSHSSGLRNQWRKEAGKGMLSSINSMEKQRNYQEARPLSMDDLKWIWKLIAYGHGIAGIVFLVEISVARWRKKPTRRSTIINV